MAPLGDRNPYVPIRDLGTATNAFSEFPLHPRIDCCCLGTQDSSCEFETFLHTEKYRPLSDTAHADEMRC
jgi:hypothetical protein